ncbi:polysaccharide deacetylase family protein [Clostridium rectalis]|uniref:polysaccharide deacetylase family protein n=1 Tax=Clostridium rectalis TaxID=2040295 RepID=UPI000F635CAA|nr:polysaccharide deacetylase family protein [Clostridium rectalis]
MKKKYYIMILLLIFSTIIVVFKNNIVRNNKIEMKSAVKDTKKLYNVYSIMGKSNRLTNKQVSSMNKWRDDMVSFTKKNKENVFINGYTKNKVVALTFDDGPDLNITTKILEELNRLKVKANFFFIGENICKYPSVVKDTYDSGHLVLSHGYNHIEFNKNSQNTIKINIEKNEEIIHKIIGKKPAIIRPPYGAIDNKVVKVGKDTKNKFVLWSIDTLDWSQRDKENILNNIMKNLRPGDIILMHSNQDKINTLEAIPNIINSVRSKGFKFVTLDYLLDIPAYK